MAPASSPAPDGPHSDETHLPALQGSPRPHARFSRPHEDPRRPRRAQRPTRQGPQAPVVGLSRAHAPLPRSMLGRLLRPADFESVLATPAKARSAHFAAHHLARHPQRATRAPRGARMATSYPQTIQTVAHSLWMTVGARAVKLVVRHGRAEAPRPKGGHAQPVAPPDSARDGPPPRAAWRTACGWCACGRRFDPEHFRSAASAALRSVGARRARRPADAGRGT